MLFIRFPANMNSGIASMVKDWVVDRDFWTRMVHGISGLMRKNINPDIPIANATGMPKNKKIINIPIAFNMMPSAPNPLQVF